MYYTYTRTTFLSASYISGKSLSHFALFGVAHFEESSSQWMQWSTYVIFRYIISAPSVCMLYYYYMFLRVNLYDKVPVMLIFFRLHQQGNRYMSLLSSGLPRHKCKRWRMRKGSWLIDKVNVILPYLKRPTGNKLPRPWALHRTILQIKIIVGVCTKFSMTCYVVHLRNFSCFGIILAVLLTSILLECCIM